MQGWEAGLGTPGGERHLEAAEQVLGRHGAAGEEVPRHPVILVLHLRSVTPGHTMYHRHNCTQLPMMARCSAILAFRLGFVTVV